MAKHGRHAPAFVLLMLSIKSNHGLGILNMMDDLVAGHRLDSAGIYRVLKKLEENEWVESHWEVSSSGPKKKVYIITKSGRKQLEACKFEIEFVIEKLSNFLDLYNHL